MFVLIIFIAAIFGAIGQYLDKHLVNMGISRKDYFYYMCVTMVPFSIIMVVIEYLTNQLRFTFSIIPILLLLLGMYIRYKKQHTIVGCLKHLNPYEDSAYLTLGIVVAFIIDVILRIEEPSLISFFSIFLTIIGVFIISNSKLKIKNLRKDLLIRISTSLIMNYITHYMLIYWSNALFLLFMNLFLVIIFAGGYKFEYHIKQGKILKWVFIQQFFGFCSLYLCNYLSSNSVTLSTYVKPTSIIIVVLIATFYKDRRKRPTLKQILGILLVVIGVLLINY